MAVKHLGGARTCGRHSAAAPARDDGTADESGAAALKQGIGRARIAGQGGSGAGLRPGRSEIRLNAGAGSVLPGRFAAGRPFERNQADERMARVREECPLTAGQVTQAPADSCQRRRSYTGRNHCRPPSRVIALTRWSVHLEKRTALQWAAQSRSGDPQPFPESFPRQQRAGVEEGRSLRESFVPHCCGPGDHATSGIIVL